MHSLQKNVPGYCCRHEKEPSLRIVYKDFPIFGDNSLVASKAALAAGLQHQYLAMHEALLEVPDQLTEEKIFKIAQDLKIRPRHA